MKTSTDLFAALVPGMVVCAGDCITLELCNVVFQLPLETTAIVTATCEDGSKWGWGPQPVIRYETASGEWAWIPGTDPIGATITL